MAALPSLTAADWSAAEQAAEAHEATRSGAPVEAPEAAPPPAAEAAETVEEESEAQEAPEAQAETETPAETDPKPASAAGQTKLEQLRALAEAQGFVFDGSSVLPSERAQLRHEKRTQREALKAQAADLEKRGTDLKKWEQAATILASGDMVGAVNALGIDPNELNRAMAARIDPHMAEREKERQRVKALEEKLAAQEQERTKVEAARHYQQTCEQHRQEISTVLDQQEDAQLKASAKVPVLVERARAFAEQAFRTGESLPPQHAMRQALRDAEPLYRALASVFGNSASAGTGSPDSESSDQATDQPEIADRSGAASAKPTGKKPPKSVSKRRAADASATKPKPFNHEEWLAQNARALEASNQ